MAARILANLLVLGGGILARGMLQAYRQALQIEDEYGLKTRIGWPHDTPNTSANVRHASKSGVAQETLQNAVRRGSKAMTELEARQILGVTEKSSWEEIAQKYDKLFERNATNGSFYLQSKVHRAKECLETVYQPKDMPGGSMG